jgi:hypothetical protein
MLDAGWEIGIDYNEQYEVPKHIKVALSFKPIHTFLPRKVKYKDGISDTNINAPFITLDKKAYPAQAGAEYGKDENGKVITTKKPKNVYLD